MPHSRPERAAWYALTPSRSIPKPTCCEDEIVTSAAPRIEANTTTTMMTVGMAKPRALRDIVDMSLVKEHDGLVGAGNGKPETDQAPRHLGQIVRVGELACRKAVRDNGLGGPCRASGRLRGLDGISGPASPLAADTGVADRPLYDEETPSRGLQRKLGRGSERNAVVAGDRPRAKHR